VLVLFVMTLFVGRLVQLQGLDASALAADALGNRLKESRLPAVRGDITDANGVALAHTVERRDVTVDQRLVPDYEVEVGGERTVVGVEGAVERLAPLLEMGEDEVRDALTGDAPFAYVVKGITPEVWREVSALRIPGVLSRQESERLYPAGEVAGNLLGFISGDGKPLAGLEMTRDDVLAGQDGLRRFESGGDGQMIPTGDRADVAPVPGDDVRLTLERDLQWYAQRAITAQVDASQAEWGQALVLEVETGRILALAESPTVDPNDPGAAPAQDRGTRALSEVIEPGSTAKVVTAAAVLEEGLVTPQTRFAVPDRYTTENGQSFKDSHDHPVENLTFAGVLAQSSNTGTVMAGEQMSRQTRHDYLSRFGFGQPTGLGFPGETRGILAQPDAWDGRQEYTVLFGQGVAVNALQSAQVFATIANDGVRMPPRLVEGMTSPDGTWTPEPTGEGTEVVSVDTAQKVRTMLEAAVAEGTGGNAQIPGYRVAGKTGTAQAPSPNGGYSGYTGSFIGMAPADDPKFVVAVTVQRPANGYYGGTVAAPVFQDLMSYTLAARKVPPSGEPPSLFPLTY
jgi:cell division protein FtsI (penicillin-binding protein 3)